MHDGSPVVQVPLLNFQTYAPMKIPDLKIEITEGETHRWKFYIYDTSELIFRSAGEMWARWLTHRDLRAVSNGEHTNGSNIIRALRDAERIGDLDYRDALVDAWMLWLQSG